MIYITLFQSFTIKSKQWAKTTRYFDIKCRVLQDRIDEIYTDNPEYGYRFIHKSLLEEGFTIGRDRTLKYMSIMGIEALYPKKKKSISMQNKDHKIYPYLLTPYWQISNGRRSVYVPQSNEVWSGDITYIRTPSGFMYMAAIIDWHSKAILSYKLSNSIDSFKLRSLSIILGITCGS